MPEATMRTSVTIGMPACNACIPARAAACWKCTRRANSRSPEAWMIRRTTCHSTVSKEWVPTSASMIRKLSAMICSGVSATPVDTLFAWFVRIRHNLSSKLPLPPGEGTWPQRSPETTLGTMTVQERVLVRRIGGLKLLWHRLTEIFFAQLVPQAQTLPLRFSENLLLVGEERVGQKHRRHLFTETIPHP